MNLRQWSDGYGGITRIVRRHFQYRKPESITPAISDQQMALAIYSRSIDPAQLGLSVVGTANAYRQGERFVKLGVVPSVILHGPDQRNRDGALATAEAIKARTEKEVSCFVSPSVAYPIYTSVKDGAELMKSYGDHMVHRTLAGCHPGVWSEPPEVFRDRVLAAINAEYPWGSTIMFEANFELMVMLYYLLLKGVELEDIPLEGGWCPSYGDCLVVAGDGTVALFDSMLELKEE